ncbi:unnamed protein product [Closterium sp. NIES-54]
MPRSPCRFPLPLLSSSSDLSASSPSPFATARCPDSPVSPSSPPLSPSLSYLPPPRGSPDGAHAAASPRAPAKPCPHPFHHSPLPFPLPFPPSPPPPAVLSLSPVARQMVLMPLLPHAHLPAQTHTGTDTKKESEQGERETGVQVESQVDPQVDSTEPVVVAGGGDVKVLLFEPLVGLGTPVSCTPLDRIVPPTPTLLGMTIHILVVVTSFRASLPLSTFFSSSCSSSCSSSSSNQEIEFLKPGAFTPAELDIMVSTVQSAIDSSAPFRPQQQAGPGASSRSGSGVGGGHTNRSGSLLPSPDRSPDRAPDWSTTGKSLSGGYSSRGAIGSGGGSGTGGGGGEGHTGMSQAIAEKLQRMGVMVYAPGGEEGGSGRGEGEEEGEEEEEEGKEREQEEEGKGDERRWMDWGNLVGYEEQKREGGRGKTSAAALLPGSFSLFPALPTSPRPTVRYLACNLHSFCCLSFPTLPHSPPPPNSSCPTSEIEDTVLLALLRPDVHDSIARATPTHFASVPFVPPFFTPPSSSRPTREIEDTVLLALLRPDVYDSIARATRTHFESNRPRAVLFDGPPGEHTREWGAWGLGNLWCY